MWAAKGTEHRQTSPVVRKYSVLTEIIDIFTNACKVCIHDEDVAETDFVHTFETPKGFRSGFGNLALRQQLAIWKRHKKRPQIRTKDRLFWIMLCRFWSNWQEPLIVVKPETVIRWHRKGFKLFWKFKSRLKGPGAASDQL